VAKPKATNVKTVKKPRTKTEKVVDKIVGTGEKVVGDVEGKPGKKVTMLSVRLWSGVFENMDQKRRPC
jgi:hypothetical protein